ncbi:MAG: HEAT repeat domain-containing protein [Gemmatimonadales bacterium]
MTNPSTLLADLARLLLLLRDHPERKEELKLAFKDFATGLTDRDHDLTITPTGFIWDDADVPVGTGDVVSLHDHLRGHGIGEIRLPSGLMTSTLLSFLRIVAAPVGSYGSFDHLTARLDAAGCGVVPVLPFNLSAAARSRPSQDSALDLLGRVSEDGHLNALGPDAVTEDSVGMMHFVTLRTDAVGPLDNLTPQLGRSGTEKETAELLNQVLVAGEQAAQRGDWGELIRTANQLIALEAETKETRGYGIAIRRLLPRSVLERVGRLTAHGQMRTEASAVMRRMGADGTEVLLGLLVNAENVSERRGYFSALKEMTEGGQLLVHMLSHDQWFVIRNVADLCGELKLESAVPALSRQMGHSDERVRRSVAGALARIGGVGAVEPLRRALRDSAPPVRLEAAQHLDGRKSKNLAATLMVAAEEESRPEVQREMYLALGRIGSLEAIKALSRAAEPGGRLFRRKPTSLRLAAVAGLHAAGPSGAAALKELLGDDDKEIREVVEKALATLWE